MALPTIQLNKDQKQKIFLTVLLLMFTIYGYFSFLLAPLNSEVAKAQIEITQLEKKIADGGTRLRTFNELKGRASDAGELIAQANAFIPDGAPIAWFPPRLHAFFDRQGLRNSVVRQRSSGGTGDRDLDKKFLNSVWSADIPLAEFFPLAIAVAGLENEEILLEITQLTIAARENPELQQVSMEMLTLLKTGQ